MNNWNGGNCQGSVSNYQYPTIPTEKANGGNNEVNESDYTRKPDSCEELKTNLPLKDQRAEEAELQTESTLLILDYENLKQDAADAKEHFWSSVNHVLSLIFGDIYLENQIAILAEQFEIEEEHITSEMDSKRSEDPNVINTKAKHDEAQKKGDVVEYLICLYKFQIAYYSYEFDKQQLLLEVYQKFLNKIELIQKKVAASTYKTPYVSGEPVKGGLDGKHRQNGQDTSRGNNSNPRGWTSQTHDDVINKEGELLPFYSITLDAPGPKSPNDLNNEMDQLTIANDQKESVSKTKIPRESQLSEKIQSCGGNNEQERDNKTSKASKRERNIVSAARCLMKKRSNERELEIKSTHLIRDSADQAKNTAEIKQRFFFTISYVLGPILGDNNFGNNEQNDEIALLARQVEIEEKHITREMDSKRSEDPNVIDTEAKRDEAKKTWDAAEFDKKQFRAANPTIRRNRQKEFRQSSKTGNVVKKISVSAKPEILPHTTDKKHKNNRQIAAGTLGSRCTRTRDKYLVCLYEWQIVYYSYEFGKQQRLLEIYQKYWKEIEPMTRHILNHRSGYIEEYCMRNGLSDELRDLWKFLDAG